MRVLISLGRKVAVWMAAGPALIVLTIEALLARRSAVARQREGKRPRIVYGPVPIISIREMSRAMQRLGYDARTFVYSIYGIHTREDFDYLLEDFAWVPRGIGGALKKAALVVVGPYAAALWVMWRFDVFHFFFDGGFLGATPLRFLEVQLLHLAGKKVVVTPYGRDVAVPTAIRSLPWRHGLMRNYPAIGRSEPQTRRWIDYFSEHADFIVGCVFHIETMPRWDLLATHYYPVDTDSWRPAGGYSRYDGRNGPVTVVHAPNHRGIKGTEFLVAACESLKQEGYQINLRLLEGVPNSVVKEEIGKADICAEQFLQGFALTALEGMSLGKPVMSNLVDSSYYDVLRMYTGLDECPIVSTDVATLKDNLRLLVTQPDRRRELGEAGRRYVLRYHSYAAMGEMWDRIYGAVWRNETLDLAAWPPKPAPQTSSEPLLSRSSSK
jgi:glycosyltransferase involved in cell wall biosynthesis